MFAADIAAAPQSAIVAPAPAAAPAEAKPAAAPLPPEVRAMIEAAIASSDPASVATVARFARQACPGAAAEIDRLVGTFHKALEERQAAAERERRRRLAEAGPLEGWKGQAELGGSRSTGSTSSLGVYAALAVKREGLRWRHRIEARAELQRTNGVVSKERVTASWQPRYGFDERLYTFGLAQYEHDPFLGFDNRTTAGGGAGYSLLSNPRTHLELEGGPTLRMTDFRDGGEATTLAARASANFAWKITPRLQLKQSGSLFLEASNNGSGTALTELEAALFGPLKLRLSYELRYERDDFRNVDTLDSSTRATFVYAF